MKKRTGRGPLFTAGVLTLLSAVSAGLLVLGAEPSRVAYSKGQDAELLAHAGWYRIGPDEVVLLAPSAHGGLFVADFENYRSGRVDEDENGVYVWTYGRDKIERIVKFQAEGANALVGFTWVESVEEHFAEKVASHGYAQEEVYFLNGDVELSGIVFTPRTPGPHPAAVFIHGSGVSDRDNLWYQLIVDHLVKAGVAVLLPDKRGCGKSGGEWEVAGFDDFARDALAGVQLLKTREDIDAGRIGLVGISQGGWIAPLAASLSSGVAFVVSLSGTTVTPNEQLLHESEQTLIQRGTPAAAARAMAGTAATIAKARRRTWWKKNGDFDPIRYWSSLKVPGLLLYGDKDEGDNVPVQASVDRVNEYIPSERDVTVKVFAGTGHGFMDTETGRLREDFLDYVAGWLKTKTDF